MSSLLRVAFGIDTLVAKGTGAQLDGIGNYVRDLGSALAARGDIELTGVIHGAGAPMGSAFGERTVHLPVQYSLSALYSFATGFAFPGTRKAAGRCAIYHAPDMRIPRLSRTPVVATVHDAIPLRHPDWVNPRARRLKNALMRRAVRWADRIITGSRAAAQDIVEQYGIAEERIARVPLGVHGSWFEELEPDRIDRVLRNHGLRPGYFLTVGTLQPRKNIPRLLDAYLALPAALREQRSLVVVGREGWLAGPLRERLQDLARDGQVRWLRYVDDESLRCLYRAACALVFVSLCEGFGLPLLEAFASQTPAITSCLSSLPEIAGDAALQVDPLDTDAIASAMMRIAEDAALARMLAERGGLRARQFTWEACAAGVNSVYRSLI